MKLLWLITVLGCLPHCLAKDKVTFYRAAWRRQISNPVILTLKGASRLQCKTQCIQDENCFALSTRKGSSECNILALQTDFSAIASSDQLDDNSDYITYIKRIPCNDSLCENGGKCEVYQPDEDYPAITYSCVCPKRFCGRRCESAGNVEELAGKAILFFNFDFQKVTSKDDCIALCLKSPKCKSIVFQMDAIGRSGGCWLKEVDHTDAKLIPGVHIISDPNATYVHFQGSCQYPRRANSTVVPRIPPEADGKKP